MRLLTTLNCEMLIGKPRLFIENSCLKRNDAQSPKTLPGKFYSYLVVISDVLTHYYLTTCCYQFIIVHMKKIECISIRNDGTVKVIALSEEPCVYFVIKYGSQMWIKRKFNRWLRMALTRLPSIV